jgi:sorbitol-specific phosphotransferase system component IIBC
MMKVRYFLAAAGTVVALISAAMTGLALAHHLAVLAAANALLMAANIVCVFINLRVRR